MPRILMTLVVTLALAPFALADVPTVDQTAEATEELKAEEFAALIQEAGSCSYGCNVDCFYGCDDSTDCQAQEAWLGTSCNSTWVCEEATPGSCVGMCVCS